MQTESLPKLRGAIYTRTSNEHSVHLPFGSLSAQREACEAYVRSQAAEGWQALPERCDDGGIAGNSLERPALQRRLLTEIRKPVR